MLAAVAAASALQANSPPSAADIEALSRTVAAIAASHPMDTARIGVSVVDVDDGTMLYQRDADHEFAPASNFKLITAAAALAFLGSDFRFVTRLEARGALVGDTLDGDLILIGGGDPTLTRADLAAAAASVVRSGIHRVTG